MSFFKKLLCKLDFHDLRQLSHLFGNVLNVILQKLISFIKLQ